MHVNYGIVNLTFCEYTAESARYYADYMIKYKSN